MTAITCYECIPEPPVDWCQFTSNATDCDEKSKTNGAEYDVCAKTSFEIVYEGDNHLMNIMNCAKKVCKKLYEIRGGVGVYKKNEKPLKKTLKKEKPRQKISTKIKPKTEYKTLKTEDFSTPQ